MPERHLAGVRRRLHDRARERRLSRRELLGHDPPRRPSARSGRPARRGSWRAWTTRAAGSSPGMSAEVRATLAERAAALTVPEEAVFAEGDANFVYVVSARQHRRAPRR